MRIIECEVCGADVPTISTGVCVKPEVIIADTLWDYTNCPECGCQILLKRRYRDINDPYFAICSWSAEQLAGGEEW